MSQTDGEEATLRKTLATLDVQRKAVEHEADAIYLELTTPPEQGVEPMGVDTPLVDSDGYPRGDIDVYRARSLRNRFHVLQTDHKQLVRTIDDLLVRLAAMKVSEVTTTPVRLLLWNGGRNGLRLLERMCAQPHRIT